jgi:hypothetical protein
MNMRAELALEMEYQAQSRQSLMIVSGSLISSSRFSRLS